MSSATTLTRELDVPTHDFLATAPTLELSVVIVSYNVQELLRQCLRSVLEALEGLEAEILVVDNASTDGTVEALAPQFPQVRWIALERRVGFGRANNIGIAQARGRYILILNPDTLLQPDTLKTMLAYMEEHPEVGIAGCRVLNADGTFQASCRRGFPTPWAAFTKLFGLQRLFPRSRLFARYNPHFADEREVAYARGHLRCLHAVPSGGAAPAPGLCARVLLLRRGCGPVLSGASGWAGASATWAHPP
jgi:Predicted glycosyltransferases